MVLSATAGIDQPTLPFKEMTRRQHQIRVRRMTDELATCPRAATEECR